MKSKPKVMNVLGRPYKIQYKDLRPEHAFGLTDNRRSMITIDQTLVGKELEQTLLHELFHAVLYRTGASLALQGDLEEVVVDSISTFLTDHFDFFN